MRAQRHSPDPITEPEAWAEYIGTTVPERRARVVRGCPCEAMATAASYIAAEWSDRVHIGYAGFIPAPSADDRNRVVYVFQARAGDGSVWLIWADRYGNRGTFTDADAIHAGGMLDVDDGVYRAGGVG